MRYFVCHVLLIISICNTDILARDIEHFTTADGLAHNHVSAFCQDMYGYLWIGTWDGLSRFDGHTFTNYKYKTKDPSTIHSDQVLQITEAPDGNLWVLTRQGLSRYDRQNGIFTRFENIASEKENIPKRKIRQIVFDNHNRIWGFCHEGLFVFDQETGKIHRAAISDVYIKHGYMLRTEKGLWLASTKGLFLFGFDYLSTNKNVKKSEAIKSLSFDDENINAISMLTKLSTGLLMAKIDKTGLLVIDPETGICKIPDTGVASEWEDINYISEIMPGEVWIGTNNSGILIFDLALGKFVANSMIKENIGNQNVYSIFRDNQENIWTGTLNGALRYKLPLLKFDSWKFDPVPNNIGNPNRIFALVVDTANKHLWVGAKGGGLKMVNLANNDIRVITPPVLHNNPSGSKNASCLFLLNNDELLVGYNNMLWLYNNRSGLFTEFKPVSRYARTIFRDRDKRLWITDLDSLTIAEERAGKYVFRSMHHSAFLDKANYMGCIHQDKNGQMWMGSGFGLLKFNETQPDKSLVFAPPGSGPDRHVFAICESQDGLLWLGTNRNGIYAFDPEMEDFVSHYCDTSGLINNSVYAIVEDEKNNLWISTQSGISRFDPSRVEFTNFSKTDGLPFFEFNSGAFFKANTGKIYFGGEGGLIAFYPGSFIQTAAEIPFSIHGIKSKKGIVPLLYPIRSDTKFSLSNAENSLEISFGHFDLRTSKERNYRYKLLGLNAGWIEVPVNYRLASFYNLDPGNYSFVVQSKHKNQTWKNENIGLGFEIRNKAFWYRDSFLFGTIAALLLSLVTLLFLRMKNINIKKEMRIVHLEREANLSTLNFLKSQMNPHFIFNTLNAINNFVLQSNIRSANKYLTMFAKLMREILEGSKKEFITVDDEIKSLRKYLLLQQLRFPDKFDYEFIVSVESNSKKIPPMFIQPFIENSVEYAFDKPDIIGQLVIEFKVEGSFLICTVKDNGIGMDKSKQLNKSGNRKSTAIKNIYHRIEILKKIYQSEISLTIKESNPENEKFPGTFIELKMPDFAKVVSGRQ